MNEIQRVMEIMDEMDKLFGKKPSRLIGRRVYTTEEIRGMRRRFRARRYVPPVDQTATGAADA